jgi:methyltransferase-like protein/2-polyprenyl-3-methyl-5-hydroxy-6-metoxy-1,4-benzoquinol methylase
MSSYDETPYVSNPFVSSSPGHLHTVGTLFRLNPPDIETARVLEIGCASGGNILPLAYRFPDAQFVGIDLSNVQIEDGQKQIAQLGLTNIRLEQKSLTDLNADDGGFDYIICHGVFSWVTPDLQEAILDLCSRLLSPKGIAYISFNTFPGWSVTRTIRDMMRFHIRGIEDDATRAKQARAILSFVLDGMRDDEGPYARFLRTEAIKLARQEDSYLLHEHLEEENNPVYFTEFMDMAGRYNLQYLADAHIATMFAGNLPEDVGRRLQELPDIVQTEQYMDFIHNRRFRCALVCHADASLERNLSPADLQNFFISSQVDPPDGFTKEMLDDDSTQQFSVNDVNLNINHPISKHAMYVLVEEKGRPIAFADFASTLSTKLDADIAEISDHLINHLNLARLLLAGLIDIHSRGSNEPDEVSEKPIASAVARLQAQRSNQVTNLRHHPVKITDIDRVLLTSLDGSRNVEELTSLIAEQLQTGVLSVKEEVPDAERPATQSTGPDVSSVVSDVERSIPERLDLFRRLGLLIG